VSGWFAALTMAGQLSLLMVLPVLFLECQFALSWNAQSFLSFSRRRSSTTRRPCTSQLKQGGVPNVSGTTQLNEKLWEEIKLRFQGDFDNYNQVLEDRRRGMLPREGGGHENIHCTLIPLSESTRLASFYFDGTPQAIFRFRYYELVPQNLSSNSDDFAVDTLLYTLNPQLESLLRQQASEPNEWKATFDSFNPSDRIRLLPKCDVRWSWKRDPILHSYAGDDGNGIHAVMVHGEAIVESQMSPGQQILILDQLSLYPNLLYIHDRGFDPATGDFIYGNRRNVPYQLDRVATVHGNTRIVVNERLRWTLGPEYRSPAEYESRINEMGGPSNPRAVPVQK
jgi:CpeT/CpcT family (DUF1001)